MLSHVGAFVIAFACTSVWLGSSLIPSARPSHWLRQSWLASPAPALSVSTGLALADQTSSRPAVPATSTLAVAGPPSATAGSVPTVAASSATGRTVVAVTRDNLDDLLNWLVFAAHALPPGAGLTIGTPDKAFAASLGDRGVEAHFRSGPRDMRHGVFWRWISRAWMARVAEADTGSSYSPSSRASTTPSRCFTATRTRSFWATSGCSWRSIDTVPTS